MILTEYYTEGISAIFLNRPQYHNAFNDELILKLTEELQRLDNDPSTKIILLAGKGKNFSAGADLEWMKKMVQYTEEENFADAMQLVTLLKTLRQLSKPTIGCAQGSSLGGAVGLLACCNILIAHQEAKFCFSEAKLGLIPATIAPYIIQAIGERAALYYFLTAKIFDATEAKQRGLVHELVEEDVLEAGVKMAREILKNGPQALLEIKELLSYFVPYDDALLTKTAQLIAKIRVSPEAQEGLCAFFEKRRPEWQP